MKAMLFPWLYPYKCPYAEMRFKEASHNICEESAKCSMCFCFTFSYFDQPTITIFGTLYKSHNDAIYSKLDVHESKCLHVGPAHLEN